MEREITGYHKDEEGDWVAELSCYHGQHVRHNPPFTNRPWVETASGRNSKLGEVVNCTRCNKLELPENVSFYKKTPEFTEATIPKGFQKDHSTKEGTWGIINVIEGELIYSVNKPVNITIHLKQGEKGIIPPRLLHSVKPKNEVKFYVEFYSNILATPEDTGDVKET